MNIFYFFFFFFPLLIFFDPTTTTVCDLPSSPPPPLVRTVTYGYLPTYYLLRTSLYLPISALLKAVLLEVLWWWFWLCLQTLGILCPHRLVPLALFGLTEPSDPLRFVRPQPKSPPFSLNYPLSTTSSYSSSSSIVRVFVHPKSNHPNNCSTELYSARNGSSYLAFFFFFNFLFPPSRY